MKLRRASYWLLVAVAVMTVLGHICAEPFHAHAGVITAHEQHDSHHDTGDGDPDAVHAASCDAVKAAPAADGVAVLVARDTVSIVVPPLARQRGEVEGSVVRGSPPLFLLHAVLLI